MNLFDSGANIAAIGYHIEITNPSVQWRHFPHDPHLARDARIRFLDSSTPLVSMRVDYAHFPEYAAHDVQWGGGQLRLFRGSGCG